MTASDLIKKMFLLFPNKDNEAFFQVAQEYIEHEKKKNHTIVAKELENALNAANCLPKRRKRFKSPVPIPKDAKEEFPLLEIQHFDINMDHLLISFEIKQQFEQIISEFKNADLFATYNLQNKRKILFCGKPGTGKTFSAQIISSVLKIPLVYVRFDSIISSYLGETALNLRRIFDFIESGTWIILFDEFDIIGKDRDDSNEHGEIKRVVNNFLQMIDNVKGNSIILAATNHQHMLDSAIWRRFDDIIYYELPDVNIRRSLFENYLRPIKKDSDVDLLKAAIMTQGLSPADIKMITEEAMKVSILASRNCLGQGDIKNVINKFIRREKVRNNQMCDKG